MKKIITKTLLIGSLSLLTITAPVKKNQLFATPGIDFMKARAKTMLSQTFNLNNDQGISDFIRYNYYAFNGAAGDYEIQQGLGFLEVINNILGSNGVGGVLGSKGYASCESIPTSGSASGSVSAQGQTVSISFTFGAAKRKVPSHFPHKAGEKFDASVNINTPMGKFYVEMKCAGSNITTAYNYSINNQGTGETVNEAFYQKDESTNAVYVDFYMSNNTINVIDINRFVTTDGSKFSIYHFGYGSSMQQGNAYAITGTANEKVNVNAVIISNLTGDVVPKNIFSDLSASNTGGGQTVVSSCIDMQTNAATTGCLALESTADLAIDNTTYSWNFNSIKNFTTSTSPF